MYKLYILQATKGGALMAGPVLEESVSSSLTPQRNGLMLRWDLIEGRGHESHYASKTDDLAFHTSSYVVINKLCANLFSCFPWGLLSLHWGKPSVSPQWRGESFHHIFDKRRIPQLPPNLARWLWCHTSMKIFWFLSNLKHTDFTVFF